MDAERTQAFQVAVQSEGRRAHQLLAIAGPRTGEVIPVPVRALTLGRADGADLVLEDPAVSRHHCRVQLGGERLLVEDLGSTNGTFIDGMPLEGSRELPVGSLLQVGTSVFAHECREEAAVAAGQSLAASIERATHYVRALLPTPVREQAPAGVVIDWVYEPSESLGGDCLGYHWIDHDHLALYVLDVCGHGVDAALHSVSALNVLRAAALPDVDFREPLDVLTGLNESFQMDDHGGMYLTLWYGVYRPTSRTLSYASAGHPPGLLIGPDGERSELRTPCLPVGVMPGVAYESARVRVPAGARLFVFTDGAYEIRSAASGEVGTLEDFLELLAEPTEPGVSDAARVDKAVRAEIPGDSFPDDFTLLVATMA